jgi:acyl-CoA thioester hydrolase
MALKDDPARLRPETYPLRFEQRVLYADMDSFRHLNNGAAARYFEEGRASLNIRIFGASAFIDPPDGLQLLFATVVVDYLAQAYYPGSVEVCSGIVSVGRTSWVVAHAAIQDGVCFALSESVLVKARYGKPEAVTDDERAEMVQLLLASHPS